jgi:lysophospholipase L1-like esterase
MSREWVLLGLSVSVTLALAVALLRCWAPGLLGIPPDLQMVQVSEEVVPFYENVLGVPEGKEFILKDPYLVNRARPLNPPGLLGPTDILGFRNKVVPNAPDVIAIGDSQTFGMNAPLEANWPSRLGVELARQKAPVKAQVYSMATGGWGAVQYLDMVRKASVFGPKVVVVAFYSGNDPMESFRVAYAVDHWKSLRVDPSLSRRDAPKRLPRDKHLTWGARLRMRREVIFTPQRRLHSMQDHPVTDAGWKIMAEASRHMAEHAAQHGHAIVFTVIPTKELVYLPLLERHGIALDPVYAELVRLEQQRLGVLSDELRSLKSAHYVDLVRPLQRAVLDGRFTHQIGSDGHPVPRGYAVIARVLARTVAPLLERSGADAAARR